MEKNTTPFNHASGDDIDLNTDMIKIDLNMRNSKKGSFVRNMNAHNSIYDSQHMQT
jgi:hypothetical protein